MFVELHELVMSNGEEIVRPLLVKDIVSVTPCINTKKDKTAITLTNGFMYIVQEDYRKVIANIVKAKEDEFDNDWK